MAAQPGTKLFYKIGEVSRLAGVEPYVLRYWESEFPALSPRKNSGGQRVYQQKDLDMVLSIKRMLHDEGLTIAGARRRLSGPKKSEAGPSAPPPEKIYSPGEQTTLFDPAPDDGPRDAELADALKKYRRQIREILDILR